MRLAGATRAGCLIVYPGGRNHHTFRHAERLFLSALDSLLSLAEAADVTLAIEPMHPACAREWTFLTDIESTIALIERINSPNLKLVFDTYHFGHDLALLSNLRERSFHTSHWCNLAIAEYPTALIDNAVHWVQALCHCVLSSLSCFTPDTWATLILN